MIARNSERESLKTDSEGKQDLPRRKATVQKGNVETEAAAVEAAVETVDDDRTGIERIPSVRIAMNGKRS